MTLLSRCRCLFRGGKFTPQLCVALKSCETRVAGIAAALKSRQYSDSAPAAPLRAPPKLCAFDPLTLLEPERETRAGTEEGLPAMPVHVPFVPSASLAEAIALGGSFSLGDGDDPHSQWSFGLHGELFQYRYLGRHRAISGLVAVADAAFVEQVLRKEVKCPFSWADVLVALENEEMRRGEPGVPNAAPVEARQHLRFVGRIVDAAYAGVLVLPAAGDARGLLISSEYDD